MMSACSEKKDKKELVDSKLEKKETIKDTVIIDCNYTFEESILGSPAPQSVIQDLRLISVQYLSFDDKIHQGQILTHYQMVAKLEYLFDYMLKLKFPIQKVIPIVKYDWNDDESMLDNNTYSFCYRNVEYSKHAYGLAIDINPFQNPIIWKGDYAYRASKPHAAVYDPSAQGTFVVGDSIVSEFRKLGFYWGRNFTRSYDNHHFELKSSAMSVTVN